MFRLIRWVAPTRRCFIWIAAGIILRLVFIWFPRPDDPDTLDYLELGHNLLHHGIYGLGSGTDLAPMLFRLPGYPIFLATFEALFARFWPNNWFNAVFVAQAIADLSGGLLLAAFARRHLTPRAGEIALVLAMLCPFTAVESAIAMTESLSIFAVALGIYAAGRAITAESAGRRDFSALLLAGVASALATLLRPDGVLLFMSLAAGLLFYTFRVAPVLDSETRESASSNAQLSAHHQSNRTHLGRALSATSILSCIALIPLVLWTIRNYADFHVFQPLAPRMINDPGERPLVGVRRWLRTWSVEYVTTATVVWNLPGDYVDPIDISPSAFDSPAQRAQTLALIAEYNQTNSISADLDSRFNALAEKRIRAHPLRYYVELPILRVADMLLRPRTEAFYLEVFWWPPDGHPWQTTTAALLGLINLFYVGAAAWAFLRGRVPFAWMLGGYLVLRFLLLGTMENPEPRYTLECFPIFIVAAAAALSGIRAAAPGRVSSIGGDGRLRRLAISHRRRASQRG